MGDYYQNNIFPKIAGILGNFSSLFPHGLLPLVGFFLIAGTVYLFGKNRRYRWTWTFAILLWFSLGWLLLFLATPLRDRMGWNPASLGRPDVEFLLREQTISLSGSARESVQIPPVRTLADSLSSLLADWKGEAPRKVPVLRLVPKGCLFRCGFSAFYSPLTAEVYFDPAAHHLEWPFTWAHELCHAHGFTDEGECNWLAFQLCRHSGSVQAHYSADLFLWREAAFALGGMEDSIVKASWNALPQGVQQDLDSIRASHSRYPTRIRWFSDSLYPAFLRMMGVTAGGESYQEVLGLELALRRSGKTFTKIPDQRLVEPGD